MTVCAYWYSYNLTYMFIHVTSVYCLILIIGMHTHICMYTHICISYVLILSYRQFLAPHLQYPAVISVTQEFGTKPVIRVGKVRIMTISEYA